MPSASLQQLLWIPTLPGTQSSLPLPGQKMPQNPLRKLRLSGIRDVICPLPPSILPPMPLTCWSSQFDSFKPATNMPSIKSRLKWSLLSLDIFIKQSGTGHLWRFCTPSHPAYSFYSTPHSPPGPVFFSHCPSLSTFHPSSLSAPSPLGICPRFPHCENSCRFFYSSSPHLPSHPLPYAYSLSRQDPWPGMSPFLHCPLVLQII